MTEIMLTVSGRSSSDQIQDLQNELKLCARVFEPSVKSFDPMSVALIVAFTANALQVIDILAGWLKRKPSGNRVVIRLSDGRELKMEANTNPDDFIKQLKAALKDL